MQRDIQFDIVTRVRAAGVTGAATLRLSPADAQCLMDGFQEINSDWNDVQNLDRYPGTDDGQGLVRYALDEALPWGTGLAIDDDGTETPVHLDGLTG